MRTIEWPKDSGRTAVYDDDELAEIAAIVAAGEERGIPRSEVAADLAAIHNLKVELGARLLGDPVLPDWVPPAGSPFRPPESVVAELTLDGTIS